MSSAASPNSTGQSAKGQSVESSSAKSLRTPPSRPQLMGPPARPKRPPAAPAPAPARKPPEPAPEPTVTVPQVIGPISAPSERMQYRAIGMLKGKYVASEEQFNRGNIAVEDGTLIDSVLLGRVTSLIRKHIDLETEHVWVVYPRTLYNEDSGPSLHMQIVGVWEPETLNSRNSSNSASSGANLDEAAASKDDGPRYLTTQEATEQCDHFSIRGEIAKYDEEKEEITINIVQKSKSETAKPKRPFKLLINGKLTGRTVGYFWDLEVQREEGKLILQEAKSVAVVPPKRKPRNARKDGRRRSVSKPRSGASRPVPKPKTAEKSDAAAEDSALSRRQNSGSPDFGSPDFGSPDVGNSESGSQHGENRSAVDGDFVKSSQSSVSNDALNDALNEVSNEGQNDAQTVRAKAENAASSYKNGSHENGRLIQSSEAKPSKVQSASDAATQRTTPAAETTD